jgi:hypothetical protein
MDNIDYPPNPVVYKSDEEWKSKCLRSYDIKIKIEDKYSLEPDINFWYVGVQNSSGDELSRKDFTRDHLDKIKNEQIKEELITIYTGDRPYKYIIWPYKDKEGWQEKFEVVIPKS